MLVVLWCWIGMSWCCWCWNRFWISVGMMNWWCCMVVCWLSVWLFVRLILFVGVMCMMVWLCCVWCRVVWFWFSSSGRLLMCFCMRLLSWVLVYQCGKCWVNCLFSVVNMCWLYSVWLMCCVCSVVRIVWCWCVVVKCCCVLWWKSS